ncbi:MAG: hypothetical protein F4Y77_04755 [Holophagales bacterium]|nr:hypothetical protein [Holophagales bacterium]
MGCGGGGGGVTDVGVLSPTLSVQLPEPPPYGYTLTVCVPAESVPLQESSLVPPRFVQEELFTRQSMSLSMPVRLTLTSAAESRLKSYDSSPAPVSDTVNGNLCVACTVTVGGSAGRMVPGGAGEMTTVDVGGGGGGEGSTQRMLYGQP